MLRTKFLFQTGSIRSLKPIALKKSQTGFYSKLVRLEGGFTSQHRVRNPERFYSKLVRLEVVFFRHHRITREFLFQTGSIRSSSLHTLKSIVMQSFYSKLVRLEGIHSSQTLRQRKRFYSKLVRLEGRWRSGICLYQRVSIPNWFD